MGHFYGEIQGYRGEATRIGSKTSGFSAHIRGWNIGVRVELRYDEERDCDVATVHLTGGSNNPSTRYFLSEISTDRMDLLEEL